MADRTVARRYAKAFIELARETGEVDALLGDLQRVGELVGSNGGELLGALSNPVFTVEERKAVLGAILPRANVRPMTRNLLMLLLDKGRFQDFSAVLSVYSDMADEQASRQRVTVETAEPLTPQLEAEVRASLERVTGKAVILDTVVNPDLIGGMVARVGSKVYDASVRARLEDIRTRLIRAQVPAEA